MQLAILLKPCSVEDDVHPSAERWDAKKGFERSYHCLWQRTLQGLRFPSCDGDTVHKLFPQPGLKVHEMESSEGFRVLVLDSDVIKRQNPVAEHLWLPCTVADFPPKGVASDPPTQKLCKFIERYIRVQQPPLTDKPMPHQHKKKHGQKPKSKRKQQPKHRHDAFAALLKTDEPLSRCRLLMTHCYATGQLKFPGGKVNEGESPFCGMRREFQEETGIDLAAICDHMETVVYFHTQADWRTVHYTVFVLKATAEAPPTDSASIHWGETAAVVNELLHPLLGLPDDSKAMHATPTGNGHSFEMEMLLKAAQVLKRTLTSLQQAPHKPPTTGPSVKPPCGGGTEATEPKAGMMSLADKVTKPVLYRSDIAAQDIIEGMKSGHDGQRAESAEMTSCSSKLQALKL